MSVGVSGNKIITLDYAYNILIYPHMTVQCSENSVKKKSIFKFFYNNFYYFYTIREHSCEVLFEQDNEETSIATLLLESLILVKDIFFSF